MVAKIMTSSSLHGVLLYNQKKVDKDKGSVLGTHILREPADGQFSVAQTVEDFLRWMPTRYRCEEPILHISINPDPKDKLDDWQMVDIANSYMERMGWGGQPYIIFKHTDIERTHIHIVSLQVDSTGRKIKDSMRNNRSWEVVQKLEKEYGLHPAKEQERSELWQLAPVDYTKGNLKSQISSVIKPAVSMYRFQTMGELRALLSFYNIGVEEVRGERAGHPYRGLVYTALDSDGDKAEVKPIKSSVFGKAVGIDALEKRMVNAADKIKKGKLREQCRQRVAEAFVGDPYEDELRERLKAAHIDLYIRRNKSDRIVGVTFIDHEKRCVLNGSRLGKEFSANALEQRYGTVQNSDLYNATNAKSKRQVRTPERDTAKKSQKKLN